MKKILLAILIGSFLNAQGVIQAKNSCLQFDGVNGYVDCGNNASLKIYDKSFTLEAWIKPATGIPYGFRCTIITNHISIANPGWIMDLADDAGVEGYRFYNGIATYKYVPPGNLVSLEWTHFIVTRDLTESKLRIFLNGELKQTWDMTTVIASTNPVLIGSRGPNSDNPYPFNGLIDEVCIYSRTLSPDEISYNYTHRQPYSKDSLKLWLKMDEGTGTVTYDSSQYNNNGTLYNGVSWSWESPFVAATQ
jgi:hypothetical protein